MQELKGNIAEVHTSVKNDNLSALKARISAVEAAPQPDSLVAPAVEAAAPATAQVPQTPKPETPPAETPKPAPQEKAPQGLKDEKGEVDPKKTQEATEHLLKRTQEKEAALAKFKEAQRKFTQVSQELSKAEKEGNTPPPPTPSVPQTLEEGLSPELEKQIYQDLEKAPVPTMLKMFNMILDRRLGPIQSEIFMTKAEKQEADRMKGLERLAEKGNDWVWTPEGMDKLHAVLEQRPYLKQDPDPYGAAFRFLDDVPSSNGTQRGSAPATGLTPTLGANAAVPPSASPPPPSTGQVLEKLGEEMKVWISRGNYAKAREIQAQMDKLVNGY